MPDQLEREEVALEESYNRGELTLAEYNKALLDLQRDYQAAAREAAQRAHDEEMDRW